MYISCTFHVVCAPFSALATRKSADAKADSSGIQALHKSYPINFTPILSVPHFPHFRPKKNPFPSLSDTHIWAGFPTSQPPGWTQNESHPTQRESQPTQHKPQYEPVGCSSGWVHEGWFSVGHVDSMLFVPILFALEAAIQRERGFW